MRLFSRKQPVDSPAVIDDPEIEHLSRSYTPGKGKATPKRTEAQRRKALPPPANRREAMKRAREKQREDRAEQVAGMKAGDERYLLPRDKGPERALVRDIVDSRRTVGTWFFGGAFIIFIAMQVRDVRVQMWANIIWFGLAIALVIDSILIARKAKRMVRERFPKSTERMGSLYMYAIMRGITFRRLRMPKTRVKIGEQI